MTTKSATKVNDIVHSGDGCVGIVTEVVRQPVLGTTLRGKSYVMRHEEQVYVYWWVPGIDHVR